MSIHEGGRELPGRLSFALEPDRVAALAAAGFALVAFLTRLPLRTHYLLNWDADQFALGMASFDLVHHQPHPPGYLGYLALGRGFELLFGDPNSALVALSIAGEAAGVAIAFLFARTLFGWWAGCVTAAAMLVSPLYWYYGEAANTYALEPLLALGVAWLAWRCWNRDPRAAPALAVSLAVAGAIRPSTEVLLAPLAAVALIRLGDARRLLLAGAVGAAANLAWLVPLLALSGGIGKYVHASTALGSDVTTGTAVWEAGLTGLQTTADAILRGTVWELGGFTVIALFGLVVAPRLPRVRLDVPPGWGWFCAVWAAPALATFLLVHIGQVAYVQVFTPAVVLTLGPALTATVRALGRPGWAPALAAAAAAISLVVFALPARTSLYGQLREHDTWVAEMTATVSEYDPASTVIVADAYGVGSYRTAQVYLPEYQRIGIARDRYGDPGEIFGDVYEPERFASATPLIVPPGVRTYVFVDRSAVEALVADPERMRTIRFPDGSRMYVWTGPPPAAHAGMLWLGDEPATVRRGLSP